MQFDQAEFFKKVIGAVGNHSNYLDTTDLTLGYYYLGKPSQLSNRSFVFPFYQDQVETGNLIHPVAYNPMQYLINAFVDELANTEIRTKVTPYPLEGKEPWDSYANQLEEHVKNIHQQSRTKKDMRFLLQSFFLQSYAAIYTNGTKYWYLGAQDFIPGDPKIMNVQDQPYVIRITSALKENLAKIPGMAERMVDGGDLEIELSKFAPTDSVKLYDVWSKVLDKNILYTEGGKMVYEQPMPNPKRYPFGIVLDRSIFNSWFGASLGMRLVPLLKKYQDAMNNLEESSRSIANPILTYDSDAGIDVNALQRALKEGYKRIIVGKNREGNLAFIAPGQLPQYSLSMPDMLFAQMLRILGLTDSFLGLPGGVRERGALNSLIKASFRQLGSVASLFEDAMTDIDNYIVDYANAHQLLTREAFHFINIEEVFSGPVRYQAKESFVGFVSQDTNEQKNMIMLQSGRKLISNQEALRQLGYENPKRIMDQIKSEALDAQLAGAEIQREVQTPTKDLPTKINERLQGKLNFKYELTPISDEKVLVRIAPSEVQKTAFILSDFTAGVFLDPVFEFENVGPEGDQGSVEVVPRPTQVIPEQPQEVPQDPRGAPPQIKEAQAPNIQREETRGRPTAKPQASEDQLKAAFERLTALRKAKQPAAPVQQPSEPAKKKVSSTSVETGKDKVGQGITEFSELQLRNLVSRSHTIKSPEKFVNLPAMYVAEPHASWMFTGKKSTFIKARKLDIIGKPMLLAGDKIYGVMIVRGIINEQGFNLTATEKFHMVSPQQARKWWKDQPLYLYMYEFHPFEEPLEYNKPDGIQTFIKKVDFVSTHTAVPASGDLKAIELKPFRLPPVHKPEKKAFQPNEVFSLKRLTEIIPESAYDVSYKVDGIRCFMWADKGVVKFFSDEGNLINPKRIQPLIDYAAKKFKTKSILLDGELILTGVARKDITGYLHSLGEAAPADAAKVRFVVWDCIYNDKSLAAETFSTRSKVLDTLVPYKDKSTGKVQRVKHVEVKDRAGVPAAAKKVISNEGIIIRDLGAAYWATHSTYKMKKVFDVDARIFGVQKTEDGLPIFHMVTSEGIYIGKTYAQASVQGKVGDVIRVNVEHVSLKPDGSIGWYAPTPTSSKGMKLDPNRPSLSQKGIGRPDGLGLLREIYFASGGTMEEWNSWTPKHKEWATKVMPKLLERIRGKISAGVNPAKT